MSAIARPFGQFLMFLFDLVGNYGLALMLFAVVVKVILLPFQMKSKRGMMRQSRLQPKLEEIKTKHAANKTKLQEEQAKLFKEEGINPMGGCLWSLLPFPIMIALFLAIRQPVTMMMGVAAELIEEGGAIFDKLLEMGFEETMSAAYIEVEIAQFVSAHWSEFQQWAAEGLRQVSFNLGPMNLGEQPQWNFLWNTDWGNVDIWLPGLLLFFIPLVSGGSQFLSASLNRKMNPAGSPEAAGGSAGAVMKFMPLMSVWFGFILPAALGFYWTIGTVLQIGQDFWLTKRYTKILDEEDAVKNAARKKKEAEIEAKRLETERRRAEGIVERNENTSKRKKKKTNKQDQIEKAAEWEKKNAPPGKKGEPGRVGDRRYARGRAYDPHRYKKRKKTETNDAEEANGIMAEGEDLENPGLESDAGPVSAGEDSEFHERGE